MAEISEVKIRLSHMLSAEVSANQLTLIQHSGQEQFGSARTDRVSLTPEEWRDLIEQLRHLDNTGWLPPMAARGGA